MKEDLSKKKVPFLLTCKDFSNKQAIVYFMGTLILEPIKSQDLAKKEKKQVQIYFSEKIVWG